MLSIAIYGIAGLIMGIMAGVLPGLGTGSLMALMSMFLLGTDATLIIVFYLAVLVSAQYFGSVTAILTGVPGDPAAMPSAVWGFPAARSGQARELLYQTAKWSLISGISGFGLFLIIVISGTYWAQSLGVSVQWILLSLAVLGIATFSANSVCKNILLVLLGAVLASVGYSENFMTYFWVDPDSVLSTGIPWLPVMIGVMVVPGLLSLVNAQSTMLDAKPDPTPTRDVCWPAGVRGSIIGFVLGTVPGMSYVLGSMMASKIESAIQPDPKRVVVSAEAANNSGAVSMLLPLILLGIPITASDSVVFALLTANQSQITISDTFRQNWLPLIVYFVLINCILFVLAWRAGSWICQRVFANGKIVAGLAMFLCGVSTIWLGYTTGQLSVSLLALSISTITALIFRRCDFSPLVYMMIMYPFLEVTWHKASQLYF